ncbi:MAG: DUF4105 domain-containing protein [Prevotella sp.]|nr:DUF4105 domain-containing protein [Prevotella sp.]
MKHLEKVIKLRFIALITLIISEISVSYAQNGLSTVYESNDTVFSEIDPMDSVEVSLITCSPHEEIYSLYGHSALRWHDLHKTGPTAGQDLVFNWGLFNFNKPYFVLRFVFGLTDYELGTINYEYFVPYYRKWGSSVTEQVINLTNDEKRNLKKALAENLKPENKVYRYNYFYDNCSTRPRDIIERSLNGKVEWADREDYKPTFREMVRECNRNHDWSRFGNDILLGLKADFKTDRIEQEFLPMNLMQDMAMAQVYVNGEYRPLVKEQRDVVPPGVQMIEPDWILSPTEMAIIIVLVALSIMFAEWKQKKCFIWWDVMLMVVEGLIGLLLTVMIFSQHPTTSINLNILLFNPLPLFFIPSVIKGRNTWFKVLAAMIVLYALGSIWQSYPEGIWSLALCLLSRIVIRYAK